MKARHPVRSSLSQIFCFLLAFALLTELVNPLTSKAQTEAAKITILFKPGHPVNRFVPSHAFGAALDGHEKSEVQHMLSPKNVNEMLTAGLKSVKIGRASCRERVEI